MWNKQGLNKWRDISCRWIERLSIILFKLIYRFNTAQVKLSTDFYTEDDKWILKSVWKCKGKQTLNKTKLKSFFKTYCESAVIKAVWHWCKNGQMGKWNKWIDGESRNRSAYTYSLLIFNKILRHFNEEIESLTNGAVTTG